jgi:hypothetical protein
MQTPLSSETFLIDFAQRHLAGRGFVTELTPDIQIALLRFAETLPKSRPDNATLAEAAIDLLFEDAETRAEITRPHEVLRDLAPDSLCLDQAAFLSLQVFTKIETSGGHPSIHLIRRFPDKALYYRVVQKLIDTDVLMATSI